MFIVKPPVEQVIELENNIFLVKIYCPEIASVAVPGQFVNVRVNCESILPFLRRPFSISNIEGDFLYLMFNVYGEGTKILASKKPGEKVDLIGPLGKGFNIKGGYETAVIAGGGLGVAPFPFFSKRAFAEEKKIISFIGGRTSKDVITFGLSNVQTCTDDGSKGFKGNVIDLMIENVSLLKSSGKIKVFACGPNAMLRTLKSFVLANDFDCEVSTECAMACGFGICQGCPIESSINPERYLLVCKDGPVFNIKDIEL